MIGSWPCIRTTQWKISPWSEHAAGISSHMTILEKIREYDGRYWMTLNDENAVHYSLSAIPNLRRAAPSKNRCTIMVVYCDPVGWPRARHDSLIKSAHRWDKPRTIHSMLQVSVVDAKLIKVLINCDMYHLQEIDYWEQVEKPAVQYTWQCYLQSC